MHSTNVRRSTCTPAPTQSFALPTFTTKFVGDDETASKTTPETDNDKYLYPDGDSDSGYELSTRTNGNSSPGGITKPRCVEIVVNREVEQWEDNAGRRPPSRDLANAV